MKGVRLLFGLIGLWLKIQFFKFKKMLLWTAVVLLISGTIYIWKFRCLSGYEWDLSISASDFMLGISAIIGAFAIVAGGIRWLADKINKNTTIIKSVQPYLRIGDDKICYHIKSQHELSQIIREAPLEVLQKTSLTYIIRFNSMDKNENKVAYKSYCKPRVGLRWVLETEKDNVTDGFSRKIERAKTYLFNTQYHEDYYFRQISSAQDIDSIHNLECEFSLDPVMFLPFYKYISMNVRVINSNGSHTAWCKCKLNIEDYAIKSMAEKIPELKAEETRENWLKTWKENFDKNNEAKFDLGGKT
jgi:hypothetical protein